MSKRKPRDPEAEITLTNRTELAEQYQRRRSDRQFPPDFAHKTDFTPGYTPGPQEQKAIRQIEQRNAKQIERQNND